MKKLFFFFLLFAVCGALSAQTISNVQLAYSCPCMVTATYDLDAAKPADVQLFYSPDTVAYGWLLAETFLQKPAGTNTDTWDCNAAGVVYGQFFFKLEAVKDCVPSDCVWINGVCWATRNVDMPGTFAANPEDAGMFYQWNRKIGWSSTDPMVNSNGGIIWDSSNPSGNTWESENDPCPCGWRVPTHAEQVSLATAGSIWTTKNGVTGRVFGNDDNTIFLPAAGYRYYSNGSLLYVGTNGLYWSSTVSGTYSYNLYFDSGSINPSNYNDRALGFSIRCLTE